jgi:hypothetical protein
MTPAAMFERLLCNASPITMPAAPRVAIRLVVWKPSWPSAAIATKMTRP